MAAKRAGFHKPISLLVLPPKAEALAERLVRRCCPDDADLILSMLGLDGSPA